MLPWFLTNPDPGVYLDDSYVVFDFETTTHGKGLAIYQSNRICGVAWRIGPGLREFAAQCGWEPGTSYYRGAGEYDLGDLVRLLQEASFVVAHNAKFDLQWAARCGLELENVLPYDTLLGEYVLGGNRWKYNQLSLESISQRRWGEGKIDLIKSGFWDIGVNTPDIPDEWLARYCVRDVQLTERLFLEQREDLRLEGKLHIAYLRNLVAPVLADIETEGMQLDAERVKQKYEEAQKEFVQAQGELEKIAPINWNSRVQVAEYLYGDLGFEERKVYRGGWVFDRTDAGNPKTDIDTIMGLKATNAKQRKFKEAFEKYQERNGELTKYLNKFKACCDEAGGLLKAVQNQTNTQTHRLSSTGLDYNAQLHNINRAFKPLFKAKNPEHIVGEGDAATLEFSTAVHLGRDRQGLADLIDPAFDAHSVTASIIWPDRPTKEMRQDAKPHTFKPLYYGQSGTEDEQRYYKFFREKYNGISQWQEDNIAFVSAHKFLRTEWGLEFFWPYASMGRSGYVSGSTQIANYPVQSFATADIVPMALVWMWHRVKRSGSTITIINTVHDSIISELHPKDTELWHELCRQTLLYDVYQFMEKLYHIRLTVPLGCGVITGSHWGSKNETKYKVEDKWWIEAAKEDGML